MVKADMLPPFAHLMQIQTSPLYKVKQVKPTADAGGVGRLGICCGSSIDNCSTTVPAFRHERAVCQPTDLLT